MPRDYLALEGYVHKRTEVKAYDFAQGMHYEFTALVVDDQKVGHKVNFPVSYDHKVIIGHRICIDGRASFMKGWIRVLEGEVKDLGAVDFDPSSIYRFDVGYLTLPSKGFYMVIKPTGIEGIGLARVPVELIPDRNEAMYASWEVRGIRTEDRILVQEVRSTVPKTKIMTHDISFKAIRFDDNGITVNDHGEEIFVSNDLLPFRSSIKLNAQKHKLVGRIKVSLLYRMQGRWNASAWIDESWWTPMAPEKIEVTDRTTLKQIERFLGE